MAFWAIVSDTIREIRAKKLFWATLMLSATCIAGLACISFDEQGMKILWHRIPGFSLSTSDPLFASSISTFVLSPFLIGMYVGKLGTILGLVATVGIFPRMMERGSIDCILARPISRWKLFFAKYVGGLMFMVIQASFFVVGSFLVVGIRWQVWLPGYLWSILLLVVLFSYLYCVSVAFSIWTRSAMASLLLTLAFWFLIASLQGTRDLFEYYTEADQFKPAKKALRIAARLTPQTGEITIMADRLMDPTDPTRHVDSAFFVARTPQLSTGERQRALEHQKAAKFGSWFSSIGSSLLFEAVVLLLAGWRFSRKDF